MAEISSSTYSETDASNNTAPPDGFPEAMAFSGVNDAARQVMGAVKRFWNRIQGGYASTGSANAYVVTPTVALTAYVTGERYSFRASFANTAAATLNISALGAKTIKKFGSSGKADLAANDIQSGQPVTCEYDGTDMVMVTPVGVTVTGATTTEILTGTGASSFATPDAIAALWEQGSDIASAGTISVGEGGYFNVTGTTTITDIDFATDKAGRKAWLKFAGALTLTHNATTLILPGGANIVTAAGDIACFISEGADAVRCVAYTVAALIPGSKVVQTVSTQTGALATGTTVIPLDDTIPQNTEGDQYLSATITPQNAANRLHIEVAVFFACSVNALNAIALFQDSAANAIAAVHHTNPNAGQGVTAVLTHDMAAGTTSPTTFKVRIGPNGVATITLNGSGGTRMYGGVAVSSITITEYKP